MKSTKIASIEILIDSDCNYTAIMRDISNFWIGESETPCAYLHEAVEAAVEEGARRQQEALLIRQLEVVDNT